MHSRKQPVHHRFNLPLMLAIAVAALTACGDDVTDPSGLLASAEAEAVLRSAHALTLLPDLMADADPGTGHDHATLLRARELWDAGSAGDDPRAAARRRLAVGYALPVLAERLPPGSQADARARADEWIATASAMLQHLSMPEVEQRLHAADLMLRRADAAHSERTRLYYLLLAGSELVETTPRYVARTMAARADSAVAVASASAREGGHAPVSDRSLKRAERLKNWSARAVAEGDYLTAIQRAYYAIQLVETP